MRINHNIAALKANNQLAKTNAALDTSLEKLSSGYRINSAADDSAGLAISEKMRTQINGLDQSSRNASDGISVIQTAEGALVEVESMLQRMRELSVESSNGTYTSDDRVAIQGEVDQLSAEVQRISDTTEFNTMTLLDGNIDRKSYSSDNNVSLVSLSDTVAVGDYKFDVTEDARQAVILGAKIDYGTYTGERTIAAAEAGSISVNGESVAVNEGDTITEVYEKLRDAGDTVNVDVFAVASPAVASDTDNLDTAGYESVEIAEGEQLAFVSREAGSKESVTVYSDNPDLCTLFGLTIAGATAQGFDVQGTLTINSSTSGSLFESTATMSIEGNKVTVSDSDDFSMEFEVNPGTTGTGYTDCEITSTTTTPVASTLTTAGDTKSIIVSVLSAGPMDLQIGANEGQTMSVRIPEVTPKTLGIDNINVGTAEGAEKAITALDTAVNTVSAIRSKLGAYQNRLEHSIANLDTTSENMTESLSRIEDVDMAEEMAEYTQKNVLAQAGTSMLAQANQRPQSILTLLQS